MILLSAVAYRLVSIPVDTAYAYATLYELLAETVAMWAYIGYNLYRMRAR